MLAEIIDDEQNDITGHGGEGAAGRQQQKKQEAGEGSRVHGKVRDLVPKARCRGNPGLGIIVSQTATLKTQGASQDLGV